MPKNTLKPHSKSGRKVRVEVRMDASKARALERIARQRGISFSALAREGVDALLKSPKYVRFLAAVRG